MEVWFESGKGIRYVMEIFMEKENGREKGNRKRWALLRWGQAQYAAAQILRDEAQGPWSISINLGPAQYVSAH